MLAPLSRGRFERIRFAARAILESLVRGHDFLDELADSDAPLSFLARIARGLHGIAVFPLRALGRLLLRLGDDPADVFADDLVAVRLCGSDSVVHAVLRADFGGAMLEEMDRRLAQAAREGVFTRDVYAHLPEAATAVREAHNDFTLGEPPTLRGPSAGKYADVYEPGQKYLSEAWAGFPPPSEREQNAKRTFVACERDDRTAADVLDQPGRLHERLTRLRYEEVLGVAGDHRSLAPEVVGRWLRTRDRPAFPGRYNGVYDGGRPIEPGTPRDRDVAVASDAWNEVRLVSTAGRLYAQAGERAARWRSAKVGLEKVLRRTIYRPTGRDRAIVEDLEDDVRKLGRWLAALDRWAYVIHVHMAARLPNLARHDELLHRYDSLLRFQPLAIDAREYRNRVAAFVRQLEDLDGPPPFRLRRDATHEFKASRKDLALLLKEAGEIEDPFLREWTGELPLDQFLFAHEGRPFDERLPPGATGRRMLRAWDEVVTKAQWLHSRCVAAMLELHESIEDEYRGQVGPLPAMMDEPILDAIVLELEARREGDLTSGGAEVDLEPETLELEVEPNSATGGRRHASGDDDPWWRDQEAAKE
jgi:hypothetical protein